jgi:cytosine/adenosine deaminase-related metal-dependent hydrolase
MDQLEAVNDAQVKPYYEQHPDEVDGLRQALLSHNGDDTLILVENAAVVTMDPYLGDFERGDLLIEGSTIAAVGVGLRDLLAGRRHLRINGDGMVVMPGLVDTHRHLWHTQFRRLLPDAFTLERYAEVVLAGLGTVFSPSDTYIGNLLGALGAIDAGVTTVVDFSHNARSSAHRDAAVTGLADSGIRAVHASGPVLIGDYDHRWPLDVPRLSDAVPASARDRVTIRVASMMWDLTGSDAEPSAFSGAINRELLEFTRGNGLEVHVDAVFGAEADLRLQELLDKKLLGPDITLIHCNGLSPETWDRLADAGVHVSLAPTTDAQYGLGESIVPIQRCLDAGLNPGLSVDTEASQFTDMFSVMRMVLNVQHMMAANAAFNGGPEVDLLTTRDILRYATVEGARASGLASTAGALTPGKRADVVLLSAMDVLNMPLNNAVGTIVNGVDSRHVHTVFVDGVARKVAGELVGQDIARVRRLAVQSRDALAEASGYGPPLVA